MIKWEFDRPSRNKNAGLPVLDLKMFMSNKDLVTEKSAMPLNFKVAILSEEGLRSVSE